MNLIELAGQIDRDLTANRAPGQDVGDILDLQVICVCEEAGELAGAYRRWAGKARRKGTFEELCDEVADVLIVTAVFAHRAGIDIDEAVAVKQEKIYSRGWREE